MFTLLLLLQHTQIECLKSSQMCYLTILSSEVCSEFQWAKSRHQQGYIMFWWFPGGSAFYLSSSKSLARFLGSQCHLPYSKSAVTSRGICKCDYIDLLGSSRIIYLIISWLTNVIPSPTLVSPPTTAKWHDTFMDSRD